MASSGKIFAAVVVVLVATLVAYAVYASTAGPGAVTGEVPSGFVVNGRPYTFTYVATTPQERAHGLMNTKITNSTTELFAFPSSGEWQFWMYDTNTSLDIIWVNAVGSSGSVVYVVTSAQPCFDSGSCAVYTPSAPANYVIEAQAGFAAANGISAGAGLTFT